MFENKKEIVPLHDFTSVPGDLGVLHGQYEVFITKNWRGKIVDIELHHRPVSYSEECVIYLEIPKHNDDINSPAWLKKLYGHIQAKEEETKTFYRLA